MKSNSAHPKISEPVIILDGNTREPQALTVGSGTATIYSASSPEEEAVNEDCAAVVPINGHSAVFIVADGAGGHRCGDLASRTAVAALVSALKTDLVEPNLRSAILDGFELANQAVMQLGIGARTTLAVTELQGHTVRSYHAGDSFIMAVGQRGKIKLQTVPHSPTGYAVEAGLMNETEALQHEDRNVVSNMVGSSDMSIEIGPKLELALHDTLILASDGLSDNLKTEEIIERARKGELQNAVQLLAADCATRMLDHNGPTPAKPDDLTLIAFRRDR